MPQELNGEVEAKEVADQTVTDANPDADSSSASDETPDTASIIRDVLEARGKDQEDEDQGDKPDSSSEGEEAGEDDPSANSGKAGNDEAKAEGKEKDPDDFSDVPFHTHPRFRELVADRKKYRDEAEQFRGDAERYNNVQTFIDKQGLEASEAADALLIAGLAKTDPIKAYETALPWFENLAIAAGAVIPKDLIERIKSGDLTEDAARELSRARAVTSTTKVRTEREAEQRRVDTEREEAIRAQTAVFDAVTNWEADRKLKDPNFAAKGQYIETRLAYIIQRDGKAKTPDAALKQVREAYDWASENAPAPASGSSEDKPAKKPIKAGAVASDKAATAGELQTTLSIIDEALAR